MQISRDLVVLHFLDNGRMEATARQVGEELGRHGMCCGAYLAVGTGVLVDLRKRGLVMRLPDLNAWRITKAGRESLEAE